MKISRVVLLMTLLLTFGAFSASMNMFARAEDPAGAPDDEVSVETEDEVLEDGQAEPGTEKKEEEVVLNAEPVKLVPAEGVETGFVVTKFNEEALPAGEIVQCLIAFTNAASDKSFTVQSVEASLRYPMDFTYYMQNFTKSVIDRVVDPSREATFSYVFRTSDHFIGRPFGFVIELYYMDQESNLYMSTVFNKTINFVENDVRFDMEGIMLYLLFGAMIALVVMIVYYNMFTGSKPSKRVEYGTRNGNVAAGSEWIPNHARSVLNQSPKEPKRTPKGTKKSKKD